MNEKIAVVPRAGVRLGSSTWKKIRKWPAPSIFAASSSWLGMPRKNWTSRKMKNGDVARKLGTMSGANVFTSPSRDHMMNCGMIST